MQTQLLSLYHLQVVPSPKSTILDQLTRRYFLKWHFLRCAHAWFQYRRVSAAFACLSCMSCTKERPPSAGMFGCACLLDSVAQLKNLRLESLFLSSRRSVDQRLFRLGRDVKDMKPPHTPSRTERPIWSNPSSRRGLHKRDIRIKCLGKDGPTKRELVEASARARPSQMNAGNGHPKTVDLASGICTADCRPCRVCFKD